MTPDERKEYMRQYSRLHGKEYRLKNKEQKKEKDRLRYIKNQEKCKKSSILKNWKVRNVICEDFDKLHDTYINTNNCEWCNNDLGKKKCLDHNHYSGEIRGIVCNSCNMKIRYKDTRYQKCMLDLVSLFVK